MSWTDVMIPTLRVLIFDLDCDSYTYSDRQLEKLLVTAARYVEQELSFSTNYTIGINPPSISPDPTLTATLDDVFTNFTVLKSACLADTWTYRTKAQLAGLRARAGSMMELDVRGNLEGFNKLLDEGPCSTYKQLVKEYKFGNANNIKAVLSPFISNSFLMPSLLERAGR